MKKIRLDLKRPSIGVTKIAIFGLFGSKTIEIPITNNKCILVSENGAGKTTILRVINAVLSNNLLKLYQIRYNKIEVTLSNSETVTIENFGIELFNRMVESDRFEALKRRLGERFTFFLDQITPFITNENMEIRALMRNEEIDDIATFHSMPVRYLCETILSFRHAILTYETNEFINDFYDESNSQIYLDELNKRLGLEVLFLPTYRRVEVDIKDLNLDQIEFNNHNALIQFGMSDVDQLIYSVVDDIAKSTNSSFSKISSDMLKELIRGTTRKEKIDDIAEYKLRLVLNRLGSNIENSDKDKLIKFVQEKNHKSDSIPLMNLISNLAKVYEEQRELDDAITNFVKVTNGYLRDKVMVYNEHELWVKIFRSVEDKPKVVEFDSLSSGEKQIVSLFAQLYLNPGKKFAVLFDEPELSLSIKWQRTLLPDVLAAPSCKFLFATTHSPFIFDNDLKKYTVDLGTLVR